MKRTVIAGCVALFTILFLTTEFILSQDNHIKQTIQWSQYVLNGKEVVFFDGDYVVDNETKLPRLQLELPVEGYSNYIIESTFSENIKDELPSVNPNLKLPETLDYSIKYSDESGSPLLLIDILPFIEGSNNKYKRLESFTIKDTSIPEVTVANYAENSVLASGSWYKFKIKEDGVYILTYEDLIGIGIQNPENIRVYGNGGGMLPFHNSELSYDDLAENAIYMNKGSDNVFNQGDYILFYGKGPDRYDWDTLTQTYSHALNLYSDAAYYFLTTSLGPGKKIETINSSATSPNFYANSFNAYAFHENNDVNVAHTGREWFGDNLHENDFSKTFVFENICTDSIIKLDSRFIGRSAYPRTLKFGVGSYSVTKTFNDLNTSSYTSLYADDIEIQHEFTSSSDNVTVTASYSTGNYEDRAYIDYIGINAWRKLIYDGTVMKFYNSSSVGEEKITRFTLQNASSDIIVWEITDLHNINQINSDITGSNLSFTLETDTLRTFIAFNNSSSLYKTPILTDPEDSLGFISNQNLHAQQVPHLLIVTHPDFIDEAEELAELHRNEDNMDVIVATTTQVYNEFSSGACDVSAIRNYARLLYVKSITNGNKFKYLLLFGDGSFDNISDNEGNTNYIPTYQSLESLNPVESYAADDYFGLLEDDEGGYYKINNIISGDLDIGIGRIPVATGEYNYAQAVVDKIKKYYFEQDEGDWRNSLCFLGDDEDDNDHMSHADSLANVLNRKHPSFNYHKIMLDAYEQKTTVSGPSYPDVNNEISKSFEKGVLVFNYSGHGGPNGITEEKVLQKGDIDKLRNITKLPLFITATCQLSRYDDVEIDDAGNYGAKITAGEAVLLNGEGGGIGLFTTTRIVYSAPNFRLNQNIYNYLFEKDENGNKYKLGDVFRKAKNATLGDADNKLNFTLLGDPAIELSYPEFKIITDSINNKSVDESLDTLKAFSEVTISGYVTSDDSVMLEDFNGYIYPKVLDKKIIITTLSNDGDDPFVFETQNNVLFKGKASVNNGRFKFSFIVPKDISYNYGVGKVLYYARNDILDAHGYSDKFYIGGTDSNADIDMEGPVINLYLNDTNFVNGDFTNESPYIYARLFDENGINTTGIGIGHDIVATIDDDYSNPIVLNDYYEGATDDYKSGYLKNYQLSDLEPGEHCLSLKVWDTYNNSSEETITFYVHQSSSLVLGDVKNYPNPTNGTTYFQYHHNWPGTEHEVKIEIFNLIGAIVKTITINNYENSYISAPIEWNGKSDNGALLFNGIYPYRVTVKTEEGLVSSHYNKLVIYR